MFSLTSPAFESGESIPSKYTCDGERTLNPQLEIHEIPGGTQSMVLLMEDPDVPKEVGPDGSFDHWVLFNLPSVVVKIAEGESIGLAGANGRGEHGYTGPCPPKQYEPSEHRYFFRIYALDTELPLTYGATKDAVVTAMDGHIIAEAELMGTYRRL